MISAGFLSVFKQRDLCIWHGYYLSLFKCLGQCLKGQIGWDADVPEIRYFTVSILQKGKQIIVFVLNSSIHEVKFSVIKTKPKCESFAGRANCKTVLLWVLSSWQTKFSCCFWFQAIQNSPVICCIRGVKEYDIKGFIS